ncbi:uncharacterized protein JN550_007717 [Neoarthrinium moseri]|uniref:uncharacterized protein n=1 Tax=Neoarthrinium moseri TaxID=1658444 RepID=UPI001FDCCD75|nr:uncharacterized protein JN550_007717 [Neoarthrinium moseri]KAI1866329.1 hypothetical protein JN550_007717 [Neoarthrinium moseri]
MSSFLSLPRELRDQIYELCLLHQDLLDPWHNQSQEITTGVLCASTVVHREASTLFYGQNTFDFTAVTLEGVATFLQTIGNNAALIRHVHIDFPLFRTLGPSNITFDDTCIDILTNIQSACANIITLTTSLDSSNSMELTLDELDHPKVVTDALELVDRRFRASASLQEVTIELYEDGPDYGIRRKMESHGWKIHTTENVREEELERPWSEIDYDDYVSRSISGGYYDDDYDDYDIDNDSDFWRRAAD